MPARPGQDPRTWILTVRDVSGSVRITGEPVVVMSLVLDADTGLILANGTATDRATTLSNALRSALLSPMAAAPAGDPDVVVAGVGDTDTIRAVWAQARPGAPAPLVHEAPPVPGAEDLLDSMVGHLAGRTQPHDPPTPPDWEAAMAALADFAERAPWERWDDATPLLVEIETPDGPATYLAVVMGNAGIQRGLALYPEKPRTSAGRRGRRPDGPPANGIVLMLDPPSELPPEIAGRARRYGWPDHLDVVPAVLETAPDGPSDIDRAALAHLTVAAVAVVAHDRRGLVPVGAGDTTGEVAVGDGGRATFVVSVPADLDDSPTPAGTGTATGGFAPGAGTAGPGAPEVAADATIEALFEAFLAEQDRRLAPRTMRNYYAVIALLADYLEGYCYDTLDPGERARWEAARGTDERFAFVRTFGADQVAANLGGFLGDFMVRKVVAGEELLRASGTVTKKLVRWLEAQGRLDAGAASVAAGTAADAARDLPRADKLTWVLDAHVRRSPVDVDRVGENDMREDLMVIDRVERGALWLDGIGPVRVPVAASDLARPGWWVHCSLARWKGRWELVEVGTVHP